MANSMYLKQLIDKNVGPISDVRIDFPFYDYGNPKPVVLVGENGTGKSTILSNIVDAFFEMARQVYTNVNHRDEQNSHQYYKAISPHEIHIGATYLYSFITFSAESNPKYVFKSGDLSVEDFKNQISDQTVNVSWLDKENSKAIIADKNAISRIWANNVICCFGPDRYEKPAWMGDKYYQTDEFLHPTVKTNLNGLLKNPIVIKNVTSSNLQWLLDIIADSRADIIGNANHIILDQNTNTTDLFLLKQARNNLEKIISEIIGEEVYFQLNYRNSGGSRFKIVRKSDDKAVCPTLDSLSTGQSALFNLFATIVRYADNNDIKQSIFLSDITGIVIIDEIELHLHSKLQKEVLPELIKLFPKIQFVITSHSPLFLLGMNDTFGEDGFAVFELPDCEKIGTEKIAEFQNAYKYLKDTETYQQDLKDKLDAVRSYGKAIIVTEGTTDWKHLKAAFENLKTNEAYHDLFDNLDFEFFEYEPAESAEEALHKLKMGNSVLIPLCENFAKLPQPVKYIFIADRDDDSTNKKLSAPDGKYKNWGNNVYSFILPVPLHRATTPKISIEHYYTDEEIKTEWTDPQNGAARRLYMGNEFDERGIAQSINRFCEKRVKCGSSSIAIIDGSSGERVTSISENNNINYALSKSRFASMVLNKEYPFNNFNFDSFVEVFKILRDIIADISEDSHA